jgi:phosphatidylinositol alpha-mannosyltransferase
VPEGDGEDRALRIALVCPYSLSRPGGVQGQVTGLARTLSRRGHVVAVFAPVDGPVALPDGVALVATGHSTSIRGNGSVAPVSVSPAAARRGVAELRAFNPDVVHVHEPFAPGLSYALLVAPDLRLIVATFHRSGGSALYTLLSPVARPLAGRLAVRCAVSDAAAETARRALKGTYEVLFNGIETDRFDGVEAWPTTGPTALFLGRHEERKGLAVLLEAWSLLGAADPDSGPPVGRPVLWVAGDGPQTEALRRRHPESDTVRWLGVVDEDEKIRRLLAADVLVAPALGGESFGMVLVEAMAARAVVVASDIVGYRDAAGGHAVLVPPGDVPALAAALGGVFDGTLAPARPSGAGSAGPEAGGSGGSEADRSGDRRRWLDEAAGRAARWSMTSLAERYEELYRSVMVGDRS